MSIDSSANLLFNIGANTDDAEANVQRLRALMGTNLDEMSEQFEEWAHNLLGDIGTVQAAMTAGAAVMGAGLVAIGAASMEAADKYAEYVGEVARGSKTTGIAIQDMSGLKFAAAETGTSYEAVVTGMTRFVSTVVKANEGGNAQQQMFARLGISQDQVKAGEKDLMPLLMAVADGFQHMGSTVQRTAAARDLFGRGGAELVTMLGQGSEGLRKFADEAKRLGLILSPEDRDKIREYKASVEAVKAEHEALEVTVGRTMLPIKTAWEVAKVSLLEVITATSIWHELLIGLVNPGFAVEQVIEKWRHKAIEINGEIAELAKSLGKLGDGPGIDLEPLSKSATAAKEQFYGFSELLDQVRQRTAGLGSEDEKLIAEMLHLQGEVQRTAEHFEELKKAGKIDPATADREISSFVAANAEIMHLAAALSAQAQEKAAEVAQQFGTDLSRRLVEQSVKTYAVQVAQWDTEIEGLRDKLAKEKTLTLDEKTALNAQIDALEKAGWKKIEDDQSDAQVQGQEALQARIAGQMQKSYSQQVEEANRELDLLKAQYERKYGQVASNEALIEQLRKVTLAKIDADQSAAYQREMSGLQAHLAGMLNEEATRVQKLEAQYQRDVKAFDDAEKAKVLLTANGSAERANIEKEFADLRTALLAKYNLDLQGLENSQGWQGIFGAKFGQMLKGNEALEKEWATSSNQSLLMVQVAMENLKEMGQKAFEQMSEGMGSGIANALVYSKSIGAAMEASLKSTLESLASQAFAHAIFSTAWGFMDLAEGNPAGAAAAFEAAALFAAVGAASGIAGRAVPGGSGGGSGSGPGSGGAAGTSGSSGAGAGMTAAPTSTGPHVVVNVAGHVFGIAGVQALASAINDAVLNGDVQLTATNTRTGRVVGK